MHSLLFGSGLVGRLRHEIPSAAGALVLAELFYKFHSFTLECLAFLATWLVIGSVLAVVLPTREGQSAPSGIRWSGQVEPRQAPGGPFDEPVVRGRWP